MDLDIDAEDILEELRSALDKCLREIKESLAEFKAGIWTSKKLAQDAKEFSDDLSNRFSLAESLVGPKSKFGIELEKVVKAIDEAEESALEQTNTLCESVCSGIREILDGPDAFLRSKLESLLFALEKPAISIKKDSDLRFEVRVAILTTSYTASNGACS